MPEKFEAIHGKLFWNDEQRLHILAMLLEAVGLRCALSLCPPEAVRAARKLDNHSDPDRLPL